MVDIKKMLADSKNKAKIPKKTSKPKQEEPLRGTHTNVIYDEELDATVMGVGVPENSPEVQVLKDTIDRLSKIIDAVPFDKLDMILLKFASLKQWKTIKIKDPITHEKITKKVPRWSDPLNTEPDNLMRKSVETWLADFNAKRSVK